MANLLIGGGGGGGGGSSSLSSVTESTTARTLGLTDAGKVINTTNGGAVTITVPKNSVVAFPVGTTISVYQAGAGQATATPVDGTVTVHAPTGFTAATRSQYSMITLWKSATDQWEVVGDIAPAALYALVFGRGGNRQDGSGGTVVITLGTWAIAGDGSWSLATTGAGGGKAQFYVPEAGTFRVRASFLTNHAAASTATFTFGLYPATPVASNGAANQVFLAFGTVVSGSQPAAFATPAIDSQYHAESADFAAAAGYYALGVVVSGNAPAANSSWTSEVALERRIA